MTVDRELVVGRADADLTIDDAELSRRHFAVRPAEGGVEIEDLGSTNGTAVDGRRLERAMTVSQSARIEVGNTKLELEVTPAATDVTAARGAVSAPTDVTAARGVPTREPGAAGGAPAAPLSAGAPSGSESEPPSPDGAPSRPPGGESPLGTVLGGLAAVIAIALIVLFGLAAMGPDTRTADLVTKARTTELYFIPPRVGFSGTIDGRPLGRGTLLQDQTFGGPPDEILRTVGKPTPVSAKVTTRFAKGAIFGLLTATATPTREGGTRLDGTLTWVGGTGDYTNAKGTYKVTGGRPDITVPIAAFDVSGPVEFR